MGTIALRISDSTMMRRFGEVQSEVWLYMPDEQRRHPLNVVDRGTTDSG